MNKKELRAYMAGILDGEGYIGIKKTHKKEQKSPYYHERISIGMTNKEIIDLFYKKFGGSKYLHKPSKSKIKGNLSYWFWEVTDKKASLVCEYFLPYLIVKKRQAKLVCKLRKSKDKGQIRGKDRLLVKELLDEREAYYQKILDIHGRHKEKYYWKPKSNEKFRSKN